MGYSKQDLAFPRAKFDEYENDIASFKQTISDQGTRHKTVQIKNEKISNELNRLEDQIEKLKSKTETYDFNYQKQLKEIERLRKRNKHLFDLSMKNWAKDVSESTKKVKKYIDERHYKSLRRVRRQVANLNPRVADTGSIIQKECIKMIDEEMMK